MGAMQDWNIATESGTQAKIPYKFVLTGDPAQADIKIIREQNCQLINGGCADMNLGNGEMRLCDSYRNADNLTTAGVIKHEIGHFIGLANYNQMGSCTSSSVTIMTGGPGCDIDVKTVQPMDVGEV